MALQFMIHQILGLKSLYNQSFVDTLLESSDEFKDSDVDSAVDSEESPILNPWDSTGWIDKVGRRTSVVEILYTVYTV
jgi:hypothetical protein